MHCQYLRRKAALTIIAGALLLAVALPCASRQAHATCRLLLQGYSRKDSINSSSTSNSSSRGAAKIGVEVASLSCSSSDGMPVPVVVNSTYLKQHVAAFTGVQILSVSGCKAHAAAEGPSPLHALLYFYSSSHQLTLQQPIDMMVQHVQLALAPRGSVSSRGSGWRQSILAFGSSVNVSITGGMFADNAAGTLIFVRQQAVLRISNSVFKRSSNPAWGGEQAAALQHLPHSYALLMHQAYMQELVALNQPSILDILFLQSSNNANDIGCAMLCELMCGSPLQPPPRELQPSRVSSSCLCGNSLAMLLD
jgi:hypothetical protein